MTAFLLLTSAFFHAAWNALVKQSAHPRLFLLALCILNALETTFLFIFWGGAGGSIWTHPALSFALLSGFFEAGYTVTLGLAFEKHSLGVSYALMRGGAMIWVWLVSHFWLNETVTAGGMVGVLGVLVGLFFTTPRKGRWASPVLAYACSAFIAGYHLCYGQALAAGAHPVGLLTVSLWSSLPFTFLLYGKKALQSVCAHSLKPRHPEFSKLFLASVLNTASFLIFLFGLEHAEAGFALTLRNTSVVFAQFFGLWLGEKLTSLQWVGVALIALGAGLLTIT